jgi:hypothetical protein
MSIKRPTYEQTNSLTCTHVRTALSTQYPVLRRVLLCPGGSASALHDRGPRLLSEPWKRYLSIRSPHPVKSRPKLRRALPLRHATLRAELAAAGMCLSLTFRPGTPGPSGRCPRGRHLLVGPAQLELPRAQTYTFPSARNKEGCLSELAGVGTGGTARAGACGDAVARHD